MSKFKFQISHQSRQLKYQQLIDAVNEAVSRNLLRTGDVLPSVNQLCRESSLSRDTVFKAYAELKKRGIIESVPNRGYFIAHAVTKIFLFFDTFKAYKEVLYGSFLENLPEDYTVDLHFHHYNIDLFEKIIKESVGKYSKYVVMNFNHPRVPEIIHQIPQDKLLIIDWTIHTPQGVSSIYQDFGQSLYDVMQQNIKQIKKYNRFIYLYPEFTYHPPESITYFEKFSTDYKIDFQLLLNSKNFEVRKGDLYLLVSDRTLAIYLDQCAEKNLIPGTDTGVISYNETPMKKYVKEGITVISTDFKAMGEKAAKFVINGHPVFEQIPTTMQIRASI